MLVCQGGRLFVPQEAVDVMGPSLDPSRWSSGRQSGPSDADLSEMFAYHSTIMANTGAGLADDRLHYLTGTQPSCPGIQVVRML